jgi:exonuclease SbcD
MRFLHSADWHLGRYLHGTSLLEDQAAVLDQFVELARGEKVDAVVIAGDVYDRSVSSPTSCGPAAPG